MVKERVPLEFPSQEVEELSLSAIKQWMKRQPHLPTNVDDDDLLLLLHCCRYSIESTKELIDYHYTSRTRMDMFRNRDIYSKTCAAAFKAGCFIQLESTTPRGEKVLIFKLTDKNVELFDYSEIVRYTFALLDVYARTAGRQSGYHMIYDVQGISAQHILKMLLNISTISKKSEYVQNGIPFQLMGIHVINFSSVIESLISVLKRFIKAEMFEMTHFYSANDVSRLYQHIPLKMLPEDYGGQAESCQVLFERAKKLLIENAHYVQLKESQTTKDIKRGDKACVAIEPSFRKLELD